MKTIQCHNARAANVLGAQGIATDQSRDNSLVKGRSGIPPSIQPTRGKERQIRTHLVKHLLDAFSNYDRALKSDGDVPGRPEFPRAILQDALIARASDIHIEPGLDDIRVRFRIDGAISDVAALTAEQGKWLTNQFKALANLDPVARFTPKDSHAHFLLNGSAIDLRLALAPCQRGEALAIRLLDPRRLERSIDDLGLTEANLKQLEDWLENVNGMFLAVGPTGCGKTTTVYALLHELKFADRAIVSIEDPVEYEIPGINQVQLDEKHHLSFAEGVKAMLRLDPDFLMLGEVRDSASAHAAVDAAITGRVLLSTVHARDAVGVVTALRNWGLIDHEIAESLEVVVAQRLVRRLCEACRTVTPPSDSEMRWLRSVDLPAPQQSWFASGCSKCNGLGYLGRTGIFELWRLREDDYRLILAHADEHTLRAHCHESQRENLLQDGLRKVAGGITSLAELRRASSGAFPYDSPAIANAKNAKRNGSSRRQRDQATAVNKRSRVRHHGMPHHPK